MTNYEFCVPLSAEAKSLMIESHQKLRPQYISDRMMNGIKLFVNRYQQIKDESWPGCNNYEDFNALPDHIKQECANVHGFSPEIFLESIELDADQALHNVQQNVLRGQESVIQMLSQNSKLLEDKRIVDFGCYRGIYTFFAADNKCKSAIGIDARPDNVLVANTIRQTTKYKHSPNIDFRVGDLHHYNDNLQLCREADVIFLFGILYHVHDHYDILRSTCLTNVQTVMIETGIHHSTDPTILWKIEPTFELIAGHFNGLAKIPVGYPSVGYLDMIMGSLGYHRTYHTQHDVYASGSMCSEFKMPRACLIYQR